MHLSDYLLGVLVVIVAAVTFHLAFDLAGLRFNHAEPMLGVLFALHTVAWRLDRRAGEPGRWDVHRLSVVMSAPTFSGS